MTTRHLLSIADLNQDLVLRLLDLTQKVKQRPKEYTQSLGGLTVALINEKQSLRTRVTFEIGIHAMGGYCVVLSPQDFVMGQRESVPDIARNLSRWVDMVVARVFEQQTLETLAEFGKKPVINALSDIEHPCQALADFFTLRERGIPWDELCLAYVGDGNNVCHSLMLLAALLGCEMRVASPAGYAPNHEVLERAVALAKTTNARISVTQDPYEAVREVNAVYTDTWTSMGQEAESERRRKVFADYQLNNNLLSVAASQAVVMHCLPAHRGEEITDEVIEGPQSVVFEQAENRLHAQKAVMLSLLNGG